MEKEHLRHIVTLVKQGNETAFRELFDTYKDPVYRYALRFFSTGRPAGTGGRSSAAAEDAVQETFLKIWLNRASLDTEKSIQAYIYKIAQNLVFNQLKKAAYEGSFKEYLSNSHANLSNPVEEQFLFNELQELQQNAIAQLPPQRQLIYRLSRMDGLSHENIAQKLGISKNTVKDQIVKANKFIKEYLKRRTEIVLPAIAFFTSLSAVI